MSGSRHLPPAAGAAASGGISRRELLAGVAATGVLAGLPRARAAQRGGGAAAGDPDVIVVGAGVFGAWTAWSLQQRGQSVLLLDAWGPSHSRSSSGGETRLIRTEYDGDPIYTRWAWESLAEWVAFSGRHQDALFHPVGALYLYPADSEAVHKSIAMQRALDIPIEKLGAAEMARRWPQIDYAGIELGVFQPTMGALMARRGVQTLVADFVQAGGRYRQLAVDPPRSPGGALEAVTAGGGERLSARRFVFACGPWLPKLFPEAIGARIVPSRQDVFFFAPEAGDARFDGAHLPAWVDMSSPDFHYGFPSIEERGFKVALDAHGPTVDPDTLDRRIGDRALADVRAFLARRFPALAQRPLAETRVCQYENSDNGDFIIDRHPAWENVWIAGGGTGHGFKHGPAVGRHVADLVLGTGRVEPRFAIAAHQPHDDSFQDSRS